MTRPLKAGDWVQIKPEQMSRYRGRLKPYTNYKVCLTEGKFVTIYVANGNLRYCFTDYADCFIKVSEIPTLDVAAE